MYRTKHYRRLFAALVSTAAFASVAAATTTASAQAGRGPSHDFCVINSVSVELSCPTGVNAASVGANAASVGADPFMQIHLDNQKIGSEVTAFWRSQLETSDPTTVGSVPTENE